MVAGNVSMLTELLSLFGVSGRESKVRTYIARHIRPYVDDIKVDAMGNLIAHKKGSAPRVMLAAHMDEIGLMVKRIEDKGFLYCTEIGGVDPAAFLGAQVHIQAAKGKIHGFITTRELSAGKYVEKVPEINDIFVDTGLTKKELKKRGVEIGSYIHFEENVCCQHRKDVVLGKALDNRIGCYILLELAKKLKTAAEIFFVFTVQEEMGLYGAKTSAFEIAPDWGIAVDTTQANDVFDEPSRWLGKGPCITVKDGEFIANPCIVEWMKTMAKKKRIPIQLEAAEEGTTDAATIQTVRGGIPTAVLSIAVRNIHTTAGIASMKDIQNCVRFLVELMKKPPVKCVA